MKNTKNIIIITLLIVILAMVVGYSAFATQLTLNGTAEITGVWDVKIINIEAESISEGCDPGDPQYTNTSAKFDAKLKKPGDSITYVITIENAGNIDAKLGRTDFSSDTGSPAIIYETTEPDSILTSGNQTTLSIKVEYDSKCTEVPSVKTKTITGIIEYVQN